MGWVGDRRVAAALAGGYLVALVVLVLGPWGSALNRLTVACYVQLRHDWPIAPEWVRPEHYGTLLNVLLFVPAGVLLVLVTGRAWWWATGVAAAASGLVELVQRLWLDRVGSWDDVVANAAGALLGALLTDLLAHRLLSARGRRRSRRAGR